MNTPAKIARMLGWPEARRRILPMLPTGRACPPPFTPKVIVWREGRSGGWQWTIGERSHDEPQFVQPIHPVGSAPTQPAALALGLAALETASMRNRT